jgi:hypothetical protein
MPIRRMNRAGRARVKYFINLLFIGVPMGYNEIRLRGLLPSEFYPLRIVQIAKSIVVKFARTATTLLAILRCCLKDFLFPIGLAPPFYDSIIQ